MRTLSIFLLASVLSVMACSGSGTTATEVLSIATVGGCPDGVTSSEAGNVYITDICSGEVKKVLK